jgi:hypothetical protein
MDEADPRRIVQLPSRELESISNVSINSGTDQLSHPFQQDGLLPNYFDVPSSFSDSAGSALLASTAFRLAALDSASSTDYSSVLQSATTIRAAVNGNIQSSGWLSQVVVSRDWIPLVRRVGELTFRSSLQDPLSFAQEAQTSPEGQAFILLLQAAYRDYEAQAQTTSASK